MARPTRRPGDTRPRGAALALAALIVLLAGLLIGRASAPSSEAIEAPAGSGPTRVQDGVPVGHARSREGAAAAVASYQRAFADPAILQPGVMRRRLEVVASPDYVRTMLAANSPGRERLARGPIGQGIRHGIQTLYAGVPIGYRIESFSPRRARVLTWGFTLLGNASAVEPRAYFGLAHTDLVWLDGDWKIAGTEASFGPTPKLQTPPGPVGGYDVMRLARELRSYGATP
ncbi:MAG TPA: hypothetical protein VJ989_05815 [Solirubrobacterales bacterium]|nr:hypothetical protein [Solirubrobacterales bacterium]